MCYSLTQKKCRLKKMENQEEMEGFLLWEGEEEELSPCRNGGNNRSNSNSNNSIVNNNETNNSRDLDPHTGGHLA